MTITLNLHWYTNNTQNRKVVRYDGNICRIRCGWGNSISFYHDDIRVHISKPESTAENVEGIVIKLIERWNKSDETGLRHREDVIRELNDVTDALAYIKGRMNGKAM